MSVIQAILSMLVVVVCIALVIIVLSQKGKKAGLTGSIGGGGAETYWSQHKSRSKEGRLDLITKVLVAAFILLSLLISVLG